jgi:hypothetical protein
METALAVLSVMVLASSKAWLQARHSKRQANEKRRGPAGKCVRLFGSNACKTGKIFRIERVTETFFAHVAQTWLRQQLAMLATRTLP